jgi:hypothetical protein
MTSARKTVSAHPTGINISYTHINNINIQARALVAERSAGASGIAPIPQAGGKAEASLKALASTPLIQRLNNYEAAMFGDAGKIPKVCIKLCVRVCL